MPAYLRLLRPRQWIKNLFVAAPLFFTRDSATLDNLFMVLLGVGAFCLAASAVYILNDYLDRDTDRRHPLKRTRPLAAGSVSVPAAMALLGVLLIAALGLAARLPGHFLNILCAYLLLNLLYSCWLKNLAIVDLICVAIGFVLRVEAGSQLIHVTPSVWIINCTAMLALFMIIGKRRDDLVHELGTDHRSSLNGYNKPFLDVVLAMVLGALLISYMLYTTDHEVAQRMGTADLYLTLPFVIAGILRYLQIILVEERSGAPTTIVTSDPFMILSVMGWIVCFGYLVYR